MSNSTKTYGDEWRLWDSLVKTQDLTEKGWVTASLLKSRWGLWIEIECEHSPLIIDGNWIWTNLRKRLEMTNRDCVRVSSNLRRLRRGNWVKASCLKSRGGVEVISGDLVWASLLKSLITYGDWMWAKVENEGDKWRLCDSLVTSQKERDRMISSLLTPWGGRYGWTLSVGNSLQSP